VTFPRTSSVTLAEQLAQGDSEAAHRSAISRAYYGVYRVARDTYPNPQRYAQSEGSHQALVSALKQSGERVKYGIGVQLDNLRRERTVADYDGALTITQARAVAAVQRARTLLAHLDTA
jgi:hypothetical protein